MKPVPRRIIDAHHHFWDPATADYPWMTGPYERLRRSFGPSDLAPLLEANGVAGTVVVQARQTLAETHVLLEATAAAPWILGVVGWVDLTSPDVSETVAGVSEGSHGELLVGIRHLVHDEPDPEWLLRADVQRGLTALAEAGLAYDLLVRVRELPAAIETVQRLPGLRFILDHLAKPVISEGLMEPWAKLLAGLANMPNVSCKVSGLVTEADWESWKRSDLVPYVKVAVDLFGPDRLMWGSDWPVCTLAATYSEVLQTASSVLSELIGGDLDPVLAGCATNAYRLGS
jgi:L-fuconolactonase